MTTKQTKKQEKKPDQAKPSQKKNNFAESTPKWAIVAFGIFLLIFVGIFLYFKLTSPQSIAELLPADKTVGLIEVTIDPSHNQIRQLDQALADYPLYNKTENLKLLERISGVDIEKNITPWIGRRISVALISKKEQAYLEHFPIFFIETRDQQQALKFLQSLALKLEGDALVETTYQRYPVYKYKLSHNLHFTFINNYLVASFDEDGITSIIDSQISSQGFVSTTPEFHKVRNNLPSNNIIFAYINFAQAREALKRNPQLLRFKARELSNFEPYLSLYNSLGFVVVADGSTLGLQQFSYFDKTALNDKEFFAHNTKYQPNLSQFVEKNISLYIGGKDLTQQIQRLSEIFYNPNTIDEDPFDQTLHKLVANYFGSDLAIEEHLYPLLEGEYAFVKGLSDEKNEYKLLLEFTEGEKDLSHFKIIMKNIQNIGAHLDPEIVTRELPDGTVTKELVANTAAVIPSKSTYQGYDIQSYDLPNQSIGIHYAIVEHDQKTVAIIGTTKESITKSIDAIAEGQETFKNSEFYQDHISSLISSSDELAAIKLTDFNLNEITPYLEPFKTAVVSKNFFADGISTIYTFKIQ